MDLPPHTLNGKGNTPAQDSGRGSPTTLKSIGSKEPPEYEESTETLPVVENTTAKADQAAPIAKQYEQRDWTWDAGIQDYVSEENGRMLRYTLYQKSGGNPLESVITRYPFRPGSGVAAQDQKIWGQAPDTPADDNESNSSWVTVSRRNSEASTCSDDEEDSSVAVVSPDAKPPEPKHIPPPPGAYPPGTRRKKPWEHDLDKRFNVVDKPKRFFTVGRVFKTLWFEPYEKGMPVRQSDLEWAKSHTAFYGSRPVAKFRWFVVVRKRLNHSLCFSITTFGGKGATKTRRGRAVDFVVLHLSDIDPPKPDDEEEISRAPISLIIEEKEQYISPLARLDCSRIFTVEDDLKVMKIGRVHPESLPLLNEYFLESVS